MTLLTIAEVKTMENSVVKGLADLEELIRYKAWEVVGYKTCAEWFTARFGHLRLAAAFNAQVVYQLIDDGATDLEVAATVPGISVIGAETLRQKKAKGVPAKVATTHRPKAKPAKGSSTVVRRRNQDGDLELIERKANNAYVSYPTTADRRAVVIEAAEFCGMSLEAFVEEAVDCWVEKYGMKGAA